MGEPRWLDDEQQHAWRQLAALVLKLPIELERQLQREADLSHFEYWVLALLSEAEGRTLQLRQLAARANASQSRLSHVIKRLEQRGLLQRMPCPGDGRASNAVLSDAGWDKIVEAAPGHVENVRRLVFEGLSDQDVADLGRLCAGIVDRIETQSARCDIEDAELAVGDVA